MDDKSMDNESSQDDTEEMMLERLAPRQAGCKPIAPYDFS